MAHVHPHTLVWVAPLNNEPKSAVEKKCPWRHSLGQDNPSPRPHSIRQDWGVKYPHRVYPDVLAMIGNTPMVKLNKIPKSFGLECNIYAKVEYVNPGGSIKDRMAQRMFDDAEKQGLIKPGMTLIEPTSGNTGISIAMIAALKGYKSVIVMPERISEDKEAIIRAFGGEIVRCPDSAKNTDPNGLGGTVYRLRQEIPNSFVFDQFNNPGNPCEHYDITANEILMQLNNQVDMLVIGAGTGGTVTGIGRKFREVSPQTKIIGFDPEGSQLGVPPSINDTDATGWEVEGIGYDVHPGTLDNSVCDKWVKSNDTDSLIMCRRLIVEEGLLVGMSSGATLSVAVQEAKGLKKGQNVVICLPDGVRNYMSKFISDRWMEAKGYQPCTNRNNLWWWDQKVSSFTLKEPLKVDVKDTLESVLNLMNSQKVGEAIVTLPNGSMVGVITIQIIRNKLISGNLKPIDVVERCTNRILPKLDNNSTLGRAFRIIEHDRFAVVIETSGTRRNKIEKPLGIISQEDLYDYVNNKTQCECKNH